jgi:K+-transporting ATPase KdpF subunit
VGARRWNARRTHMGDYIWTGVVALLLLIYLSYVLVKPQKF